MSMWQKEVRASNRVFVVTVDADKRTLLAKPTDFVSKFDFGFEYMDNIVHLVASAADLAYYLYLFGFDRLPSMEERPDV